MATVSKLDAPTAVANNPSTVGKALRDLSFEDWVRHIFDHTITNPPWNFDPNADYAEIEPLQVIDYATHLFERAGELLAPYSDAQANQGLWFLVTEGGPLCVLGDAAIPLAPKLRCIQAISLVFEQYLAPRCTPHLLHLGEAGAGALNSVCYMWWDIFPFWGWPENAALREIDAACLSVMETTLQLPSIACQESALHGLNHWMSAYEGRCKSIISAFLQQHVDLSPELREYAIRAKDGFVQ